MKSINLQINHLSEPIGIAKDNLRLTWLPIEALRQTAFQVVLKTNNKIFLDSKKIESNENFYKIPTKLQSKTQYVCDLQLWDENDQKSEVSRIIIETGLDKEDWKAKWINPELTLDSKVRQPASYLKKQFDVKKLGNGRLYLTAHGIVTAKLNRINVTDRLYMPGTNQINKRLMVHTLDITEQLQIGSNELELCLGDGWYRGSMGNDMTINNFGTDISVLCQLEVDAQVLCISDKTWQASQSGCLAENDLMKGETYDATKEINDWHNVKLENFGYDNLIPVDTVFVKAFEKFEAKMITTPNGEKVLDFGANFSGYVHMEFEAKSGQRIILTHGESLDKDGNFTIDNFQNPRKKECDQKITYICKEGFNQYHPTMCYFGFRYVKVESDFEIKPEWFTAYAVYSQMQQSGFFECGNNQVNQLFENTIRSVKSNFVDVPTDCPTREKSGYSGDCQAFAHSASYLMDCYSVYSKWIAEQAATQKKNGSIKQVAPQNPKQKHFADGGVAWCDSFEIIPYKLFERYNDITLAETYYDQIKDWMMFCIERAKKTRMQNLKLLPRNLRQYYVDKGFLWGEWLEPGMDPVSYMKNIFMNGDGEVGTAYLHYGCRIMSDFAAKLCKKEDEEFFRNISEKAKEAYRYVYVKEGFIDSPRQCRYVRPIALGLLSEEENQVTADNLVKNIQNNNGKLNTGFLTTHELCRVLTDHGHAKTAYDLLLQPEYPGWLYQISKGATSIWEQWDGIDAEGQPHGSLNHYSYGAISAWLMDRVCGIRVEHNQIMIQPYPDQRLGFAKAVYKSTLGEIKSEWKYLEDGKIEYKISVPCNQRAILKLSKNDEQILSTGEYSLIY